MTKKCHYSFLSVCFILLFLVGCDSTCSDCETYPSRTNFLVNKSDKTLRYESYYNKDSLLFDTILLKNDTLFLYSVHPHLPELYINDSSYYYDIYCKIIIKDDEQNVLYVRTYDIGEIIYCGEEDFVEEKIKGYEYSYWTIDSAYIADKSCGMPVEELREE